MNRLNLMNRMIGRMIRNRTQIYSFRKFSSRKEVYELKLEQLTKKMEKIVDGYDKLYQNKVNENIINKYQNYKYQNYNDAKYELFQSIILGTVLSYAVFSLCWYA